MGESIAIISDIHGNSFALEAVLRDIAARDIQTIVNLGDSLFGPVDPLGTARQLMSYPDMIQIMGNCDLVLLEDQVNSATFRFVKPFIHQDIEQWIRTFRATWEHEGLLFCHGTPSRNDEYLLEEVTEAGARYKQPDQLSAELAEVKHSYIFCGHSHVFKMMYLPSGKIVVNAGSVGLPAYDEDSPFPHVMESHTPYASYVIAYKASPSHWNIEHVMVHYDWERAGSVAMENGRPDYAFAIRTGRALLR